jgi:hypothetical protein
MKREEIFVIAIVLIALFCFHGCRSINVGGTGQIGTVTGSGSVNIPVLRADDQSGADTQK